MIDLLNRQVKALGHSFHADTDKVLPWEGPLVVLPVCAWILNNRSFLIRVMNVPVYIKMLMRSHKDFGTLGIWAAV